MASLKEVKTRISSVNSTRKITSAMKMVASSKLHHAQLAIEKMRPYEEKLNNIMSSFITSLEGETISPLTIKRKKENIALVVFSSNSSLCGSFNSNVNKLLKQTIEDYKKQGIIVSHVYPIGKKIALAAKRLNYPIIKEFSDILDCPSYHPIAEFSTELMKLFSTGVIDGVEVIYHHFKSIGSQVLTIDSFLPVDFPKVTAITASPNYLIEPSVETILLNLIPKALHLKLYATMLDNLASEHAARMIAMQVATDNADELLKQLTLQYNKTRQHAITAELLDIVGGSLA